MYNASGFDSAAFSKALTAPMREVKMRITALDGSTMLPLEEITGAAIEGTVYVDSDRASRRTCQIRVIDKNGEYTPQGSDYATYGKNSLFYWDKLLQIEYGLNVSGNFVYIPLGIFMIDRVEVVAERGAAVINVDGIDLWKKFTFSECAGHQHWNKGSSMKTIIADFATSAGIVTDGLGVLSPRLNLNDLDNKTDNTLPVYTAVELGDNRGEKLLSLAESWSIDIYFNRYGVLVARDRTKSPYNGSGPIATEFVSGNNAVMLGIVKSQSGDTIKNHIIVIGEDPEGNNKTRAEAIDGTGTTVINSVYYTGSKGPTSFSAIGDRAIQIRMQTASASVAYARALSELAKNVLIEEEIRLPSIVNPLFDEYDIIKITESNSKTDDTYLVRAFDIPMQGSRQEIIVKKSRSLY
jgi:hypothetical protein